MNNDTQIVHIGKVTRNVDPNDCGRVWVHIKGVDDANISVLDKDYYSKQQPAFPLLPKYVNVIPDVGDYVLVICATSDKNSQRYYIGPIINQLQDILSSNGFDSLSPLQGAGSGMPSALPTNTIGALPDKSSIALIGRKNCDISINENDIRLHAGLRKFDSQKTFKYNDSENYGFVKLQYHEDGFEDYTGERVHSTATIAADRINLIGNMPNFYSRFSKQANGDMERKDLIPEEEMKKIIEQAHRLPYGDLLVEYLKLFKKAFDNHTHRWVGPGEVPVQNDSIAQLNEFEVDTILSDNVRIS